MIALYAGVAWSALPIPFRIAHDVDFLDANLSVGDDFFRENKTYLARWAYVEARDTSAPLVIADSGWTDDDGEIELMLEPGHDYRIRLYAQHDVDLAGREFQVWGDTGNVLWAQSAVYTAPSSIPLFPVDVAYDAAAPGKEWINVAAVGSFLIRRRPAAFPTAADNGALYVAVIDPAAGSNSAWYDPNDMVMYFTDADGYSRKYSIVHEMGHMLQHWAFYPGAPEPPQTYHANVSDEAPQDSDCPGGDGHSTSRKSTSPSRSWRAWLITSRTWRSTT
jgi:hypothetical protein